MKRVSVFIMQIVTLTLLTGLIGVKAQTSATQELAEVIIKANKQKLFSKSNFSETDSLILAHHKLSSIGQVLARNGPAEIRSYGAAGSLSTISLRASGSENIAVNMNGFPVNSITAGGTDLSLFPAAFFESVILIPGAEASVFGSGTFGGALELNSFEKMTSNEHHISFSTEQGSYRSKKYLGKICINNNNVNYSATAIQQTAQNNFPFINKYKIGQPEEIRKHNAFKLYAVQQAASIKFSNRDRLEISTMLIKKEMQIPEIAGSYGDSKKTHRDSGLYLTTRYNKLFNKSKLSVGAAIFFNDLHYIDSISDITEIAGTDSRIASKKILGDISYRRYFSEHITAETGFSLNFLNAQSSNYPTNTTETHGSVFSAVQYKKNNSQIRASGSAELSNHYTVQPLFSINLVHAAFNSTLHLFFNTSNKFRRPTFNERFWQPGGNKNIQPEKAIAGEIGLQYHILKTANTSLNINSQIYYTKIHNMIRWIPSEGIWQAQNDREVHNRGADNEIVFLFKQTKIFSKSSLSYYYTRSSLSTPSLNRSDTRNQLMYVPKHSVKFYQNLVYKKFYFSLNVRLSGKRYTTDQASLNDELAGYLTADFSASRTFQYRFINFDTYFKVENLGDAQYETIKSYPMPGRMYFAGISLNLQNPK